MLISAMLLSLNFAGVEWLEVLDSSAVGGPFFQYGHRWQNFAFYVFEEGTAAGGDIRNLIADTELIHGGQGVATPGNGEGGGFRHRSGDDAGAVGELI